MLREQLVGKRMAEDDKVEILNQMPVQVLTTSNFHSKEGFKDHKITKLPVPVITSTTDRYTSEKRLETFYYSLKRIYQDGLLRKNLLIWRLHTEYQKLQREKSTLLVKQLRYKHLNRYFELWKAKAFKRMLHYKGAKELYITLF